VAERPWSVMGVGIGAAQRSPSHPLRMHAAVRPWSVMGVGIGAAQRSPSHPLRSRGPAKDRDAHLLRGRRQGEFFSGQASASLPHPSRTSSPVMSIPISTSDRAIRRRFSGLPSRIRGLIRLHGRGKRFAIVAGVILAVTSCTYGPVEEEARVTHLIRLGDSFRAVVMVQHTIFQRPTGSLNTFPNGGNLRFLERGVSQVLIDARERYAVQLASQAAPDSLWESFAAYVAGVEGDSAVYVRLSGCPRGGECHDALHKTVLFRLTVAGQVSPAQRVPSDAPLPGSRGSRAPGEKNYVRFSTSRDTITARLEEGGPFNPMFLVQPDGSVIPIGG
jgi:hypothetical protein